jgi:hypothetical protein
VQANSFTHFCVTRLAALLPAIRKGHSLPHFPKRFSRKLLILSTAETAESTVVSDRFSAPGAPAHEDFFQMLQGIAIHLFHKKLLAEPV